MQKLSRLSRLFFPFSGKTFQYIHVKYYSQNTQNQSNFTILKSCHNMSSFTMLKYCPSRRNVFEVFFFFIKLYTFSTHLRFYNHKYFLDSEKIAIYRETYCSDYDKVILKKQLQKILKSNIFFVAKVALQCDGLFLITFIGVILTRILTFLTLRIHF